jgi:pyrimidine operon attenuation protein/uracil phosphoribosyltransferase
MSDGMIDGVTELLPATKLDATLRRMALQILERHPERKLAFVGIRKRGGPLAQRVMEILREDRDEMVLGEVDITFHRDDLHNLEAMMDLGRSKMQIPDLDERCVILFDDVLYTGRTIRAAIDELLDFGRPAKIELAVLVDRGHRELPIQPDYVGLKYETQTGEYIQVALAEEDGHDGVYLHQKKGTRV